MLLGGVLLWEEMIQKNKNLNRIKAEQRKLD